MQKENLTQSEFICDECEGTGIVDSEGHLSIHCMKCNGEGKFDWVENIVGKKVEHVDVWGQNPMPNINIRAEEPKLPVAGDIYFDSNSYQMRVYDGQDWAIVSGNAKIVPDGVRNEDGEVEFW